MTNPIPFLPRVRWTTHAEPIHLPLAQVIYQIRRHDADDGLLLDALSLADVEASVEQWLALDALTSPYAQLERKMQILQRTLSRVSPTLKPVALQLTAPFKQHGSAQVMTIFELSDDQTVSIYFHNPDTTPNKLNPNDELVSWKWLLNKKDITIVVAPEKGHDLNLLDVATRVIKLAEKNSVAFSRANAKRAEQAKLINELKEEISALEKELSAAQNELERIEFQRNEAQQQAEQRKQSQEKHTDKSAKKEEIKPLSEEANDRINTRQNSDTETKEFATSQKPYADYLNEAGGDSFEAAKNFYKRELQGKIVKTVIGDVWMLGSSWHKMRGDARKDNLIASLVPHVPEILKSGKYEGRESLYKERKDNYMAFHHFIKDVEIDSKLVTAGIGVGERIDGQFEYVAYSLNHSLNESWKKRKTLGHHVLNMGQEPSVISTNADTIKIQPPILDKVNPETEAAWNIRILKVVDIATGQRLYALEDGAEDDSIIQQIVSNQASEPIPHSDIAPNIRDTATLYAFDENRSQAQRKRDNAAALALLKAIDSGEKDGQNLTLTDKAILAKYSGTGGALIGADGKKGSAYEYYTPAPIATGMWDLLKGLGFSGGKVLDPCAGTGIFSAMAPNNAVIDAVEVNETSGKINQLVNNQHGRNVTIAPFEHVASATPDEMYDAVISNVPFGGVADRGGNQLLDNKYQKEPLQNYFILRSLEKLRPGGLALFIVPPRCVSGKGGKEERLRVKISYLAEFLGAYRLPNKVFGTASADTMTDIIALRKYSHQVLEKIDELRQQAPEVLINANVQWPVFTQGHYFEEEGKRFVLGEFVAKDPAKFRDVDRVITGKPVTEIAQMLAKFPDSRINWTLLESIETLPIIYDEGNSIHQSGQTLVFNNGQWIAVENQDHDAQATQLTADLSDPYKAFSAKLNYEQVNI